uniref:Putative cysteine protease n=1 Tax=Davidia involucrata TaxID=16924 RepID=A0A5B7BTU5_DAVIN
MASTNHCRFMCLALLFILGVWASPAASSSRLLNEQSMLERHEQWMAHHGRVYTDAKEKDMRFTIFKENVERIEAFNAGVDRGYKQSVNQFADLTNEEFRASHTGYKRQSPQATTSKPTIFRYANVTEVPTTMDWREKGAVNPVKNQIPCGCCWAFSAVAAVEGINQIKTGKLISLSEQQLVDCDSENHGCDGGLVDVAFQYMEQNNGLTTEDNYTYMEEASVCNTDMAANPAVKITGHEDVPSNSEEALLQAVANQPVSVAIEGTGYDFTYYSSGVFTGTCGTNLDHAVTVVGYGTDDTDGTKYWLVKNSWGTGWGENGYMRIQRDATEGGLCGIAMQASYPTA